MDLGIQGKQAIVCTVNTDLGLAGYINAQNALADGGQFRGVM